MSINAFGIYNYKDYPWTSGNTELIEFASKNRTYIVEHGAQIFERYSKYSDYIAYVTNKYQVPREIAYIAGVESSFRPDAVSTAGAVGMWQFMPPTARDMGLIVRKDIDERLDWKKSTEAAVRYLKWLAEDNFGGDYETAVIAYNYGIGNTKRLIKKLKSPNAFVLVESEMLPRESEEYLLKFLSYLHLYEFIKIHGLNNEHK